MPYLAPAASSGVRGRAPRAGVRGGAPRKVGRFSCSKHPLLAYFVSRLFLILTILYIPSREKVDIALVRIAYSILDYVVPFIIHMLHLI